MTASRLYPGRTLLPFTVEIQMSSTVAELPTKLRKRLGVKYGPKMIRRGESTVTISSAEPDLIDELVRVGRLRPSIGGPPCLIVRDIAREAQSWAHVIYFPTKEGPATFEKLVEKFEALIKQSRDRQIKTGLVYQDELDKAQTEERERAAREYEKSLERSRAVAAEILERIMRVDELATDREVADQATAYTILTRILCDSGAFYSLENYFKKERDTNNEQSDSQLA